MSKFYNNLGDPIDERIFKFAEKIGEQTSVLINELFNDSMTILEGRAVSEYLKSQIDISVTVALLQRQCELRELREESSDEISD